MPESQIIMMKELIESDEPIRLNGFISTTRDRALALHFLQNENKLVETPDVKSQ